MANCVGVSKNRVIGSLLLLVATALCDVKSAIARSNEARNDRHVFNGVFTQFKLAKTRLHEGEELYVSFTVTNTTSKRVVFRTFPLSADERIFSATGEVQTQCTALMTFPITEIVLQPGQIVKGTGTVELKACFNLPPGRYRVRFYYDLSLLNDKDLAKSYARRYDARNYRVPWDNRDHRFIIHR